MKIHEFVEATRVWKVKGTDHPFHKVGDAIRVSKALNGRNWPKCITETLETQKLR
jgi:hypothetical protein